MLDRKIMNELLDKYDEKVNENREPKSLVKIRFEDNREFVYLCDVEGISEGDAVTVEGALKDQVGIVQKVLTSFRIPNFEMKWVESILDTDISGKYLKLGKDVVSFDSKLTVDKFVNLYVQSKYKNKKAYGDENVDIVLKDLNDCELFDREIIKERGKELFKADAVEYICFNNGVGKAIVRGSEWYEIDFKYQDGKITYLVCECPYFEPCKHEYAFLLKFKELIKEFDKYNDFGNFVMCKNDCFNYIMRFAKGEVVVGL